MATRLLKKLFSQAIVVAAAFAIIPFTLSTASADEEYSRYGSSSNFSIEEATWNREYRRLTVRGKGDRYKTVTVTNAGSGAYIGEDDVNDGDWRVRVYNMDNPPPCRVKAEQSDGKVEEQDVRYAPDNCDAGGGQPPGGGSDFSPQTDFKIMMNYELGMHCTGFEFAYCCVLPVYNSILAQVVKPEGTDGADFPELLEGDPNVGLDGLGRQTVIRDKALDRSSQFKKYVIKYWHDAQPRNNVVNGRLVGKVQTSTLISAVEGNSLMAWNTTFDSAAVDADGKFILSDASNTYNGAEGVMLGNGSLGDPTDNYQNAVWNHLYFYWNDGGPPLEGENPNNSSLEKDKIRLGVSDQPGGGSPFTTIAYPEDCGPAFHPMGPVTQNGDPTNTAVDNNCGGFSNGNVLTFSGHTGTVVYTQMKVLENLPVMLTSPDIWEALGLPLTPFEDSIDFFADPGLVDEDSVRPFVAMKAQMFDYYTGDAVLDSHGDPVIGFGTAPIDIPNCERCHSNAPEAPNSPNQVGMQWAMVQAEYNFWNAYYDIDTSLDNNGNQVDSDWYSRLKSAAISMLYGHDDEHGTSFTARYGLDCGGDGVGVDSDGNSVFDPSALDPDDTNCGDFPQNTRLGHESVICQRCHADNVIAAVKSATHGGDLIPPVTEAVHNNHRNYDEATGEGIVFADSLGRDGGCQGCHPAHRSDGDMSGYPITLEGENYYKEGDNRLANGGCFVGRDVHSNPGKDDDGAETPEHLNAVGSWLQQNVARNQSGLAGSDADMRGLWCTNCHTQLSQEIWKAENMEDLVHGIGQNNPRGEPTLAAVAAAVGTTEEQAIAWLDPTIDNPLGDFTHAIWDPDPGLCDYVDTVVAGGTPSVAHDANVATIEVHVGGKCAPGYEDGPNLATAFGCSTPATLCGTFDDDQDFSVHILDFCTTDDCVASADAGLTQCQSGPDAGNSCSTSADCGDGAACEKNSLAFAVPFSAATDGRDHWLSAGEPHCADCHAAPYVEQSGNINAYPPFNYPRKASLMRYSRGHQDISCQGCHESIHGLYPVTPNIDTTTYAQAAALNHDGSHGPLKCGTCHDVGSDDIPRWVDRLKYTDPNTGQVSSVEGNFDTAVSWMHTFTAEADPRKDVCLNCHSDESDEVAWHEEEWLEHAMKGRTSRQTMDKVELLQQGYISGTAPGQDPLDTVCRGCHGNESDEVSCNDREWKDHLIEGRVAEAVWVEVSQRLEGSSCGW